MRQIKDGLVMLTLLAGMIGAFWINVEAAPLCLSTPGDSLSPKIVHSIFTDTTSAADTVGYSITPYLRATRWPDARPMKLHGIGEGMIWTELAPFRADSVEGLEGYRRVWWSGSTVLEDSVITPGRYEVSGDSLLTAD